MPRKAYRKLRISAARACLTFRSFGTVGLSRQGPACSSTRAPSPWSSGPISGTNTSTRRTHIGARARADGVIRCFLDRKFTTVPSLAGRRSCPAALTVSTAPSTAGLLSPILSATRPTMSDLFIPVLPATVPGGQTTNPAPFRDPPAPPVPAFPGTVIALQFDGTAANLTVECRVTDKYHESVRILIPGHEDCGTRSAPYSPYRNRRRHQSRRPAPRREETEAGSCRSRRVRPSEANPPLPPNVLRRGSPP